MEVLTRATQVNDWVPAFFMSYMSQHFRLFRVSNSAFLNYRNCLLMYSGSVLLLSASLCPPDSARLCGWNNQPDSRELTTTQKCGAYCTNNVAMHHGMHCFSNEWAHQTNACFLPGWYYLLWTCNILDSNWNAQVKWELHISLEMNGESEMEDRCMIFQHLLYM